ncbi:MAG: carotenoid biosynthesis protein [Anaerolineae bacterium]|nr:carotenoid biosynthesis protein [Anaerolineae bacterium]
MTFNSRTAFWYITLVTALSTVLIVVNAAIGMKIPFTVDFLIGFIAALLVFVVWHAVLTRGWAAGCLLLAFIYLSAFLAEMLGVNFGLVFGPYHYPDLLGVQVAGVPLLAGLAWGPITYGAYHLSEFLLPMPMLKGKSPFQAVGACVLPSLLGAFAVTAWDLVIDAIAVDGGWWVWHAGGAYLPMIQGGIPVSNFTGWLGLSFFIQLILRLVFPPHGMGVDGYLMAGPLVLYGALFLTSIGVSATILLHPEVTLVGVMSMGPLVVAGIGRWMRRKTAVKEEE